MLIFGRYIISTHNRCNRKEYADKRKINKTTIDKLSKLPDQKLKEVSDFTEFLLNKTEERDLTVGIQKLAADSKSFKFLEDEEDLYSTNDLKEVYK